MKTIPQRDLRNRSGEILRAAEAGETFVITVDGRPVAVLGPWRRRTWVGAASVRDMLRTPTDDSVVDDLKHMLDQAPRDPWERA